MKLLQVLERQFIVGLSAAMAMHALMSRQQDLGLETTPDVLKKRVQNTASVAVSFANALYDELAARGD